LRLSRVPRLDRWNWLRLGMRPALREAIIPALRRARAPWSLRTHGLGDARGVNRPLRTGFRTRHLGIRDLRRLRRVNRLLWARGWTFDALAQGLRLNRLFCVHVNRPVPLLERLPRRNWSLSCHHLAVDDRLWRSESGRRSRTQNAGPNRLH